MEARTYDSWGRVLTDTQAQGTAAEYTTTNTYDLDGWPCLSKTVLSQSGQPDQTTTNTCDALGDVTASTQQVPAVAGTQQTTSADQTTTTTYNQLGQATDVLQSGDSNPTHTTYDGAGRVATVEDPLGTQASYTYTPTGDPLTETQNALGAASAQELTTFGYDAAGNRIATTKQYGAGTAYTWTSKYDAQNRLSWTHEPGVSTNTTYSYDAASTLPAGQTGYTFLTAMVTAPNGVATTTTQDLTGAVVDTQVGTQAGATPLNPTANQYDAGGRLTQTTDPNGVVTSQTYNTWNDLVSTTEASGPSGAAEMTAYAYDAAGHLKTKTDPYAKVTNYAYDAGGNLLSVTLPGAATASTFTYDAAGQRVEAIDPDGRHRDWTYDQAGNMTAKYEYPLTGSMADAQSSWLVTSYGYDENGHLTSVVRPAGAQLCYSYDAYGNQVSRYTVASNGACATSPQSDVQTYSYNPISGMTSAVDVSGGQPTINITYDPANPTRVQAVTEGTSQTTQTYDASTGALSSTADTVGSATNTTQYTYDAAYGRLWKITNPFTAQTTIYGYKPQGTQLLTRSDPNGLLTTSSYDDDGRLASQVTSQGASNVLAFTVGYDNVSRVTSLTQAFPNVAGQANPGSGTWAYSYYDNGELHTAQLGTAPVTTYQYDGAGNRTHVIQGGNDVASSFDWAGRLTQAGSTAYTWNADDQLTGAGSTSYGYDAWGHQTAATVGGNAISYAYDALDRTLNRTPASGSATAYTYSGTSQTLSSASTGTGSPSYYAWGVDGPLAQQQGANTRFLVPDTHGNLAGFFDSTGTATGTISYDPWGGASAVGADATASTLGYQSQPADPTTGLTDMGARNYDPVEGRFTTEDGVFGDPADPLSLNQYAYGQDSPIDNTDPTGNYILCGASCSRADQQITHTYSAISIAHATGAPVPTSWTSTLSWEMSHRAQINASYAAQVAAARAAAARVAAAERFAAAKLRQMAMHRPQPTSPVYHKKADGGGSCSGSACQLLHGALDVLAVAPYGVYYASYHVASANVSVANWACGHYCADAAHGANALTGITEAEVIGAAADSGIDLVKGHTVAHESWCDENVPIPANPLHQWFGHPMYLPDHPGCQDGRWDIE